MSLPVFLLLFLHATVAIEIGDDLKVNLQLVKHQSCAYQAGKSQWQRKLEFEAGNSRTGPKLEAVHDRPGCYSVGGHVSVHSEFSGNFSVFLEIRQTTSTKGVPEGCAKQGPDGCGGIGSCLYCDACSSIGRAAGVQAELLLNGKPIECADGLHPGSYDDLKLVFCLPNIDEIMTAQGLSKEALKTLLQSEDGRSFRNLSLFATVYIFDTDVRRQMQAQQRVEKIYRQEHNKKSFFKDEPLPADVYWSLPFNALIKKQQAYVACHKIYGNVQIQI